MNLIDIDTFDLRAREYDENMGYEKKYLLKNCSYIVGAFHRSFLEIPKPEWRLTKQDVTKSGKFQYNVKGYIEMETGYYKVISVLDSDNVFRKIILRNNIVIDDFKSIVDTKKHQEIIISRENIGDIPIMPNDERYQLEDYIKLHKNKDNDKVEEFLEKNKVLQYKYVKSLNLK